MTGIRFGLEHRDILLAARRHARHVRDGKQLLFPRHRTLVHFVEKELRALLFPVRRNLAQPRQARRTIFLILRQPARHAPTPLTTAFNNPSHASSTFPLSSTMSPSSRACLYL